MKMKIRVAALALCVSVCWHSFAEDYNDIVIYRLPGYAESQARSFIDAISSNGAFYTRVDGDIYVLVLSRGYGLDFHEYRMHSLESKRVVTPDSPDYFALKRLF